MHKKEVLPKSHKAVKRVEDEAYQRAIAESLKDVEPSEPADVSFVNA